VARRLLHAFVWRANRRGPLCAGGRESLRAFEARAHLVSARDFRCGANSIAKLGLRTQSWAAGQARGARLGATARWVWKRV